MARLWHDAKAPASCERPAQRVTCGSESGGERTRTADFYVANVALYRAELHPPKESSAYQRVSYPIPRWADSIAACSRDATIAVVRSPRVRSSTARS